MTAKHHFVYQFAARLKDESWLRPLVRPFDVLLPPIKETSFDRYSKEGFPFNFCVYDEKVGFNGSLSVCLGVQSDNASRTLCISCIRTQPDNVEEWNAHKNYGRELVRRAVWFAFQEGFKSVSTTKFLVGACSFWLAMGFQTLEKIEPNWAYAAAHDPSGVKEWKKRLEENPEALSAFAATNVGKLALRHKTEHKGFLNLRDDEQRHRAFKMLYLPAP